MHNFKKIFNALPFNNNFILAIVGTVLFGILLYEVGYELGKILFYVNK